MKTQQLAIINLFLLFALNSFGQQFISHPILPFDIHTAKQDSTRKAQTIFFYDYDGDGDRDLFLTGLDYFDNVPNLHWSNIHFFIEMQENIGSSTNPLFGERQDVFEQFPYPVGYFFATPGDLNGDLKMDLMTTADIDNIGSEKISMLTNTGNTGAGEFQVSNLQSMGLLDFVAESFYVPHLADLDGDGDLDLLASGFDSAFGEEDGPNIPTFYYARNVGTKNVPNFQGWYTNPYGFTPDTLSEALTSGDIDNDGDVDLIGGLINIPADSANYLNVHLNTPGSNGKPAFSTVLKSPYGMPTSTGTAQITFPRLEDMDDDGDLDLFVFIGNSQGSTLHYFENNLCQPTTQDEFYLLCEGESVTIGGENYSDPGTYTIYLQNIQNCDSIINLTIEVLPIPTTTVEASICEGEAYLVGNDTFSLPGSYMVLVASANGCDSIINLTLEVFPSQTASIEASICSGDSYVIGNDSFNVAGNYTIHSNTINGCDSTIFLTLNVNVIDASVTALDINLTANESGDSYQWVDCDSGQNIPGAVNQTFTPTVTGNYAVHLTDDLGCTAQSECFTVMVTGLEDDLFSKNISLYPNPTSGIVFIKNETASSVLKVTVTNVAGEVKGEYLPDNKNTIDLSSLGTGVYFVKILFSGKEVIKRVTVQ